MSTATATEPTTISMYDEVCSVGDISPERCLEIAEVWTDDRAVNSTDLETMMRVIESHVTFEQLLTACVVPAARRYRGRLPVMVSRLLRRALLADAAGCLRTLLDALDAEDTLMVLATVSTHLTAVELLELLRTSAPAALTAEQHVTLFPPAKRGVTPGFAVLWSRGDYLSLEVYKVAELSADERRCVRVLSAGWDGSFASLLDTARSLVGSLERVLAA